MPGPGPGSLNQMICTHTGPPTSFPRTASQKLELQNSTKSSKQHGGFATWKMHLKLLPDNCDNSQAARKEVSQIATC